MPFEPDGLVIIENALHKGFGDIETLGKFPKHTTAVLYCKEDSFGTYKMAVCPTACASFHPAYGVQPGEPVIKRIGFAMTEFVHECVFALNMRQLLVQTDIISVPDAERAGFTLRKVKIRYLYVPFFCIIKHLAFVSEDRKCDGQF